MSEIKGNVYAYIDMDGFMNFKSEDMDMYELFKKFIIKKTDIEVNEYFGLECFDVPVVVIARDGEITFRRAVTIGTDEQTAI